MAEFLANATQEIATPSPPGLPIKIMQIIGVMDDIAFKPAQEETDRRVAWPLPEGESVTAVERRHHIFVCEIGIKLPAGASERFCLPAIPFQQNGGDVLKGLAVRQGDADGTALREEVAEGPHRAKTRRDLDIAVVMSSHIHLPSKP
ncbi:hypothetical protein PYR71_24905 [Rhizobium sp. MC63]|uniref:hypothetical protein n=1 Tax=Rhizobium mulingense TaxID=3031128 RepID=UPI0023D85D19|nr:hypothetical protein [Rhizobium sp. MC63]MDF0699668.1 hypothetical protein [Rhizobium sp. MC63]